MGRVQQLERAWTYVWTLLLCVVVTWLGTSGFALAETVQIDSAEKLESLLKPGQINYGFNKNWDVLLIDPGDYELTQDITLDMSDDFFRENADKFGLGIININQPNQNFSFEGNGHTISFVGEADSKAPALFGYVYAKDLQINNIKLEYSIKVNGWPFAYLLAQTERDLSNPQGNDPTNISNISVHAPEVVGRPAEVSDVYLGAFSTDDRFASGFILIGQDVNFDEISISIDGSISSVEAEGGHRAYATGFALQVLKDANQTLAFKFSHESRNYLSFRNAGRVTNTTINIGGNVFAESYALACAGGFAYNAQDAWVEHLNLKIDHAVKSNNLGNLSNQYDKAVAAGGSFEIAYMADSTLSMDSIELYTKNAAAESMNLRLIPVIVGISSNSSSGAISQITNTKLEVNKFIGESAAGLNAYLGMNSDNFVKSSMLGVTKFENNVIHVGDCLLKSSYTGSTSSKGRIYFTGLRQSVRSFKDDALPLEQTSLKNNVLKVDKANLESPKGRVYFYATAYDATGMNSNQAAFGDVKIVGLYVYGAGLGRFETDIRIQSKFSDLQAATSDNNLRFKSLDINAEEYVSFGLLYEKSQSDTSNSSVNNTIDINELKVQINNLAYTSYFGSIAKSAGGTFRGDKIRVGTLDMFSKDKDPSNRNVFYFALGPAFAENSTFENYKVLVTGNQKYNAQSYNPPSIFSNCLINSSANQIHVESLGEVSVESETLPLAAFATQLFNSTVTNSTSLQMKSSQPAFIELTDNSQIKTFASYLGGNNTNDALLVSAGGVGNFSANISEATVLVNPVLKDEPLMVVSPAMVENNSVKNFYVTVVNDPDHVTEFNRETFAAKIDEFTGEGSIGDNKVLVRDDASSIGTAKIAPRSFQNAYWGADVLGPEAEAAKALIYPLSFTYLISSEGFGEPVLYGADAEQIKNLQLANYLDRHAAYASPSAAPSSLRLAAAVDQPTDGATVPTGATFDIYGIPADFRIQITYDANGADPNEDGDLVVPTDDAFYQQSDTPKVLDKGELKKEGYTFKGWNTAADGTGTSYQPGDTIDLSQTFDNITLFAQWEKNPDPDPNPGTTPKPEEKPEPKPTKPVKAQLPMPKTSDLVLPVGGIALLALAISALAVKLRKKN